MVGESEWIVYFAGGGQGHLVCKEEVGGVVLGGARLSQHLRSRHLLLHHQAEQTNVIAAAKSEPASEAHVRGRCDAQALCRCARL